MFSYLFTDPDYRFSVCKCILLVRFCQYCSRSSSQNNGSDNVFIYRTFHIVSWRFTILLWGEIGLQHVKAPLAAAISPYFDLTHQPTQPTHECERWMKSERGIDHHTGDYVLYSFRTSHRLLGTSETGPTVYRPYPRKRRSFYTFFDF